MSRWILAAVALAAAGETLDGLPPAPDAGARVFLVRHALAYSNLQPAPDGMTGAELDRLTDLGRAQAERTATALRDRGVALILSSPANRARETADILAARLGVPVRVEPRIRPLEVGDGLDWPDRFAEWEAGRDPSPTGGESLAELGVRVAGLVDGLPGELAGGTAVVLVAHSEVIGAYLGHLGDTPPHRRLEDSVGNASISVVDVTPGGDPAVRARDLRPEAAPE